MLVLRNDRALTAIVEVKLARKRNITRSAHRVEIGAQKSLKTAVRVAFGAFCFAWISLHVRPTPCEVLNC